MPKKTARRPAPLQNRHKRQKEVWHPARHGSGGGGISTRGPRDPAGAETTQNGSLSKV
jgi:hypothetical protein